MGVPVHSAKEPENMTARDVLGWFPCVLSLAVAVPTYSALHIISHRSVVHDRVYGKLLPFGNKNVSLLRPVTGNVAMVILVATGSDWSRTFSLWDWHRWPRRRH